MVGGIGSGGLGFEQPWQIDRRGGNTGVGGKRWETSPGGVPTQGNSSTGVGGLFAAWPGQMEPSWQHRGFYGGSGTRTGGYS